MRLNINKILTLFMVLTLAFAAPVKQAHAFSFLSDAFTSVTSGVGDFFSGGSDNFLSSATGINTSSASGIFGDNGLFGDNGAFSGLGNAIESGASFFNTGVTSIANGIGLDADGGVVNLGGLITGITNPITAAFGGSPITVTGSGIDIGDAAINVLTQTIQNGGDFGDAAADVFGNIAAGITTNSAGLNAALQTALKGGDIGDVLTKGAAAFLGGLTTGNAALDGLIQAAANAIGGVFGDLFGGFGGGIAGAGGCGGIGLGGVICNTVWSNQFVPFLFSGISYFMGILLGMWGILKLKEHVERPQQVEIWDPLKRFLAGGAFFALPMLMEVVVTTMAEGIPGLDRFSNFNGAGAVGGGLDAMLVALMRDVWTPLQFAFSGFCYLAGILLVMIGISRLLKSEQDGAKGPTGLGTVLTFLVAGALLSFDSMISAASFSMFNGNEGENEGFLRYTAGMTGAEIGHANAVINAITAFVAVLGFISFIRGLFIVRGVAEGSQNASIIAGITHILGGAIAINLGPMLEAVQVTLGITQLGLGIEFQ